MTPTDISAALDRFVARDKSPDDKAKDRKAAHNVRQKRYRAKRRAVKRRSIAILDMETDPFDNVSRETIAPFLAVLYSDEFETIIIWEQDDQIFVNKLIAAIEGLPGKFTIYAHNGGKFDFMFLVHRLRGKVSFKGRGIMLAQIGEHQLRDSYHIIPEKLASLQKQKFDYANLKRKSREKFKKEIIDYCISDCRNLLFYVKKFIDKFGFKISIGAAALEKLSEHHRIERVTEKVDEGLRRFFFGGRVECLQGAGYFAHGQKLYDINSAYPHAMASKRHPIGAEYVYRAGEPNAFTAFVRLTCINHGALMSRDDKGEVSITKRQGEFFTTSHEYETALELGLIENVQIIECVDNFAWTDFEKFVMPLYQQRSIEKAKLSALPKGSEEWNAVNAEQTFLKLLLNNAYGKTAQNPRRFKEHFLTDAGEKPETGKNWQVEFMGDDYWIWTKPAEHVRFLNVGTGASITGAVRAKLMRALHNAVNPVYCDTDSIICDELHNVDLHKTDLGAWDVEKDIHELVIAGKKLYAYRASDGKGGVVEIIRSKGAAGLTWIDMVNIFLGSEITTTNFGPTLTRFGDQSYISRRIKSTAKRDEEKSWPEFSI